MKPSSFRIRAISVFNFEAGTSTFGWRAWIALRTRVSMSAIGSVIMSVLLSLLPTGFNHSWNLAVQCKLAEAQPADTELAQIAARAPAAPAAVPVPAAEFGRLALSGFFQPQVFCDFGSRRHGVSLPTAGTASPFDAARPSLPRRCGRWW